MGERISRKKRVATDSDCEDSDEGKVGLAAARQPLRHARAAAAAAKKCHVTATSGKPSISTLARASERVLAESTIVLAPLSAVLARPEIRQGD